MSRQTTKKSPVTRRQKAQTFQHEKQDFTDILKYLDSAQKDDLGLHLYATHLLDKLGIDGFQRFNSWPLAPNELAPYKYKFTDDPASEYYNYSLHKKRKLSGNGDSSTTDINSMLKRELEALVQRRVAQKVSSQAKSESNYEIQPSIDLEYLSDNLFHHLQNKLDSLILSFPNNRKHAVQQYTHHNKFVHVRNWRNILLKEEPVNIELVNKLSELFEKNSNSEIQKFIYQLSLMDLSMFQDSAIFNLNGNGDEGTNNGNNNEKDDNSNDNNDTDDNNDFNDTDDEQDNDENRVKALGRIESKKRAKQSNELKTQAFKKALNKKILNSSLTKKLNDEIEENQHFYLNPNLK